MRVTNESFKLFQLNTIEQNELALRADSNNKAILLFNIVTIIFLPLSAFTSYFGMNVQGIANTDKNERYFWTVAAPATCGIVISTVIFAFRDRLSGRIRIGSLLETIS